MMSRYVVNNAWLSRRLIQIQRIGVVEFKVHQGVSLMETKTAGHSARTLALVGSLVFATQASAMNAAELSQQRWYIVNDSVMGGISRSALYYLPETPAIRFQGQLSLENFGGFASARMLTRPGQYSGSLALCIRVRGDGREYQMRLRSQAADGVAYSQTFQTIDGEWTEHTLNVADFEPVFRGRVLNREPIAPEQIRQIGLMLADKQPGTFKIDIASVTPCLYAA